MFKKKQSAPRVLRRCARYAKKMVAHRCYRTLRGDSESAVPRGSIVEQLLARLPQDEHDRLFPLMRKGPEVMQRLVGKRPHKSLLWRHAQQGVAGVKLQSVSVGGTLMSTPRMLVQHWVSVAKARRQQKERRARRTSGSRRRKV